MADETMFKEYLAVAADTAKLSDRRQTVSDLFLGINSLFLAAAGFVAISSHLTSWWAAIIVGAITCITIIFNIIWLRLIGRYRTLISLRIRYLEALETALQAEGTFSQVAILSEDGKQSIPVKRGVYLVEQDSSLYRKGAKVGFYRLERALVRTFIAAYIILAVAEAVLTYFVTSHMLDPLTIQVPIG